MPQVHRVSSRSKNNFQLQFTPDLLQDLFEVAGKASGPSLALDRTLGDWKIPRSLIPELLERLRVIIKTAEPGTNETWSAALILYNLAAQVFKVERLEFN